MSPAVRLGAFGLVLGLALGGGALVGNAAGPIGTDEPSADDHDTGHDASTSASASQTSASTVVVDDYEVALGGTLVAGEPGALTFAVRQDGQPVTDLDHAHLVAMRSDDGAVVPVGPGDGTTFTVTATAGDHRLFFDFRHGGAAHTAAFTLPVPADHGGHG